MRIYANTTFLDKFDRFEEGQTYEVNDGRGHGFITLGWASYVGKTPLWRRVLRRKGNG